MTINTFLSLDTKFNVGPTIDTMEITEIPEAETPVNVDALAETALIGVIAKGQDLLDSITDIAVQSQNARSFEVAAQIMNAISATAKTMIDTRNATEKVRTRRATPVNQQTNVFVGTTAEFLKALNKTK